MPLQDWIHHWEVGAGARLVRRLAAVLGFIAVALLYDVRAYRGFTSEEAMETAQLARNFSRGSGFTTKSIRPLSIHLLGGVAAPGATPDISNPPVYPVLLSALMKVAPMRFTAGPGDVWEYQPERWIAAFNQALFFVGIALLFRIALRLFDARVAWLSALLFGGTDLFWKFSISGLSTMWVIVVLLALTLCLVRIAEGTDAAPASAGWSAAAGALAGIGGLSCYSVGWIIVPVLVFLAFGSRVVRGKHCVTAGVCFLIVMAPWLARNIKMTGTPFGTASYAILEQTPPLEGDSLERSLAPKAAVHRVELMDVFNKLLVNGRTLWWDELTGYGGNWAAAFFLVGLLMPFHSLSRGQLRVFLVGSMILFFVVQALGQTHLSQDWPEINSENLLVLLAPLAFMYGAALFYTLVDQMNLVTMDARGAMVGGFLIVMSAPLLLSLMIMRRPAANSPYSPLHIQRVAGLMDDDELMMSDIPGAVAWYGNHECSWLALDDDREFLKINNLRNIHTLFLTQRTTNGRFLSTMNANAKSWGHLVFDCEAHLDVEGYGEVPSGFPLTNAPSGFLPDQVLLSDRARWVASPKAQK